MTDAQIITELRVEVAYLKHELAQLKRLIYGSKSERFVSASSPEQMSLFLQEATVTVGQQEATEKISYERKKTNNHPGRNEIPDHLPVQEVVIEPEIDTEGMVKIGEEITETLEYTKASLIRKRTIRPKYVDKSSEKIYIGELPVRALPMVIAEASLLTYIMISKYIDHLPLYRLSKMFERDFGWKVAQSTMVDWVRQSCRLLEPLYEVLERKVLSSTYIQADEIPIKVLEYGKVKDKSPPKKIMQGYQWVYYSPEEKLVYFNYREGRGLDGPKEVLENYKGYIQCDGYPVYNKIASLNEGITLLGCLAHCRRYFEKSLDSDRKMSTYALEVIGKVYEQERKSKEWNMAERQRLREEKIHPELVKFREWIEEQSVQVLPKSRIGKAMNYYQGQWMKLEAAVKNARFDLDNNGIENKIRPLALGRKNYLFARSHEGAKRAAMMYSFFGSCKQMGINPTEWLEETMMRIPLHPINRIEELLPGYQMEPENLEV